MLDEIRQQWQQIGEGGTEQPPIRPNATPSDLQKRLQTLFYFEGEGYPHLVLALIAFAVCAMALAKGFTQPGTMAMEKWGLFALGGFAVGAVFLYRFWIFRRFRDRPDQSLRDYVHGAIMRLKVIRISQYAFAAIFVGLLFIRITAGKFNPLEGLDAQSLVGVGAFALFCVFIMALVFWFQKHHLTGSPKDLLDELLQIEKEFDRREEE